MRIGICDHTAEYVQWLTGLLSQIRKINNCTIIPYHEPRWLLDDIRTHAESFDLLLISKELKQLDYVDLILEVSELLPKCQIILYSEENCIDDRMYLIPKGVLLPKEHVPLRLITVVERLLTSLQQECEHYISIVANREHILLPCSRILYMEKVLRKTMIVTPTNILETYQIPSDLISESGTSDFVQCHRSYYINLTHLFSVGNKFITLDNSAVLPIGNTFSDSFHNAYTNYCSRLIHKSAWQDNSSASLDV